MSVTPYIHTRAQEIRSHLAQAEAAFSDGFTHYLRAGELLIEQKAELAHGEWLPWLEEHVGVGERAAQNYMRLVAYREELEANTHGHADFSLEAALKQIAKPKRQSANETAAVFAGLSGDATGDRSRIEARLAEARGQTEEQTGAEFGPQEERKQRRALELSDESRDLLNEAGKLGLSAYARADILRRAEVAGRQYLALVSELAWAFER